jgi:hypothetical protein
LGRILIGIYLEILDADAEIIFLLEDLVQIQEQSHGSSG